MKGAQQPLPSRGGAAMIAAERVTELLRLANRLHRGPRDPEERKRELLDGLVAVTAAERGACAVVHDDGGPAPLVLSAAAHDPSNRKRRRRRRRAQGRRSKRAISKHGGDEYDQAMIAHLTSAVREATRGSGQAIAPTTAPSNVAASNGAASMITALVPLDRGSSTFGAIALSRTEGHDPFDGEDHHLVHVFHSEMAWVYELDLPLASPEVTSLSPRGRETLQYLLAGFSEKQTAARLKLSHNTVHHYVKQLYKHFDVSSRSELLARWVRDQPGGGPGADTPPR
jgi:DNA-binding CsgD family transcriptional regulator